MFRITQDLAGLLSGVVYGTFTLCGISFQIFLLPSVLTLWQSFYPGNAETLPVWALPRSLATTCGIIVIFFSCGYLDVSVPRVGLPLGGMVIADRVAPFGYLRVTGYLRLSVTFRSLSRPSSPPRA